MRFRGLAFKDLDGDGIDELVYCKQAGNESRVLRNKEGSNPVEKAGWMITLSILQVNNRSNLDNV